MSSFNIGYVSAIAAFASDLSRADRDAALLPFDVPGEAGSLRDDVTNSFTFLCNLAVKRVLLEADADLKTVRIEGGYGYAEHHKDWLRLGCDIRVDEDEANAAISLFENPMNAGTLEARIEMVAQQFVEAHFRDDIFEDLSCSFYLYQEPEKV